MGMRVLNFSNAPAFFDGVTLDAMVDIGGLPAPGYVVRWYVVERPKPLADADLDEHVFLSAKDLDDYEDDIEDVRENLRGLLRESLLPDEVRQLRDYLGKHHGCRLFSCPLVLPVRPRGDGEPFALSAELARLAYNLSNFLRTLALPDEMESWSVTTIREKVVKIGAKVVAHARYSIFQMAEVAVPRDLFCRILSMIDGLRPREPTPC